MTSLRDAAKKAGANMPETYVRDLVEDQAALLRECRAALDALLRDKPMLAAKVCGSTTLGNLRAMLAAYRGGEK